MEINLMSPDGRPADTAGLGALFAPTSITVVGGSDAPGNPAGKLTRNLLEAGYPGSIHPVSARRSSVAGLPTTEAIELLPDGIDLAVIAIPAAAVPEVVLACGQRGIKAALLLSSGFSEAGNEQLQQQVVDAAGSTGMRLSGPNCSGFLNLTDRVNANFAAWNAALPLPNPGRIAIISQSGGFGTFVMRRAMTSGLGFNFLISTGNEADVCVATAIQYALARSDVDVVLAFAETIKVGERFVAAADLANELNKPIVILKGGRSAASERAALSHTASIAGSAPVFDAVCRQLGVHIATTTDDLIDLASVFLGRRHAQGPRVGVLTSSGGAGVVLADALALAGLEIPEIPPSDRVEMAKLLPENFLGSLTNPVDLSTQPSVVANPYEATLRCLAESEAIESLAPVVYHYAPDMVEGTRAVFRSTRKPMVVLSTGTFPQAHPEDPPVFTDPRRAALALAAVVRQSHRNPSFPPSHDHPQWLEEVHAMLDKSKTSSFLLESEAMEILAALGVPFPAGEQVKSPGEAALAFRRLGGGAVAVKVMSYDIPHKTDFGAVRLGLTTAEDVRKASEDMLAEVELRLPNAEIAGLLVQTMVPARLELTCGLERDSVFGPMVVVGIGGTIIELLSEAVMLRAPFHERVARDAVSSLLGGRIVSGRRGLSPAELDQIARIAQSLGQLAFACETIQSIDINPLRIHDGRVVATDALMVLAS